MNPKTNDESRLPSRPQLLLRGVLMIALMGAILFGATGRWDLPYFWIYLGLFFLFLASAILTTEEELLKERLRPAAASRDNLGLLRVVAGIVFLTHWVIAGWEAGRSQSSNVPPVLQAIAMLAFAASIATWGWAMRTNLFFSAAVRIQAERSHHVITNGPYRFIRHPGYAAAVVLSLCSGLALGSWWAVLPCLVWAMLFVRRAALEDRLLQAELTGYREYAGRVQYRLLPGIW
jgi:protein-S-isoprenylcysteine O-methyltransferase Ste14